MHPKVALSQPAADWKSPWLVQRHHVGQAASLPPMTPSTRRSTPPLTAPRTLGPPSTSLTANWRPCKSLNAVVAARAGAQQTEKQPGRQWPPRAPRPLARLVYPVEHRPARSRRENPGRRAARLSVVPSAWRSATPCVRPSKAGRMSGRSASYARKRLTPQTPREPAGETAQSLSSPFDCLLPNSCPQHGAILQMHRQCFCFTVCGPVTDSRGCSLQFDPAVSAWSSATGNQWQIQNPIAPNYWGHFNSN